LTAVYRVVRVWRERTGSTLELPLPLPMTWRAARWYIRWLLPGWEVVAGAGKDPDMEEIP